jgi:hypothetical protein
LLPRQETVDVRGVTVAAALLLALSGPAAAFESHPAGGSEHDAITERAVAGLGLKEPAVRALQEGVRHVDSDEMKLDTSGKRVVKSDASFDYVPHHHCDRLPGATDAAAFEATARHVAAEQASALAFARSRSPERALRSLAYALHAVQDCHAHSNAVDLDPATQQQMVQALLEGGPAPAGVRLTGFEPGAEDAEAPEGDPYPHAQFAKDGDNATEEGAALLSDGRTKSQAARELAVAASRELVDRFLRQLTPEQREAVAGVTATQSPHKVPAAGPLVALAVLACAAAARRRG